MIEKEEAKRKKGFQRGLIKLSRNRLSLIGTIFLWLIIPLSLFAPWIAPYPEDAYDAVHFESQLQPPSFKHWFGTDEAGRDILSRILYGGRISLMMAVIALVIAVSIGIPLGIAAGYYGGNIAQIIMRITDIFCTIPPLVLALVFTVVLSPGIFTCMIAVGLAWWRSYCLIAYGETLSIKQETFVTVCRSFGTSNARIMFFEIFPNMTSTILVKLTLDAGYAILIGTAISFLGVGANPPTPEWGLMVAFGRHYLPSAWWASFFPGLAIFLTVFSFNLLGDGLRDFLDVEVE